MPETLKQTNPRTYQLGELRRPHVGGDDVLTGNPVGVDVDQGVLGADALGGLQSTDQDTVRVQQILDGGTLSQELGVRQDVELHLGRRVGIEDGAHALSSAARHSRLLDDDFGALGNLSNAARSALDVAIPMMVSQNTPNLLFQWISDLRKVSGTAGAHTGLLGGGVDRDEDKISLLDGTIDVGGEEQVLAAALKDNLLETGLVDGQLVRVPGSDTGRVDIDDGDLDVMALVGNYGTSGTT